MEKIHCIVTGRVQMVMYRDFVKRSARSLGLSGFVRNVDEGSVEVVAQGEKGKLEAFITRLRKGSMLSRVADVRVEWSTATCVFDDFQIL